MATEGKMAIVVNIGRGEAYDVRIDRKTKLGNPFVIGKHGTRDACIAQYRPHLWAQIRREAITLQELAELDGRRLGCWCAPLPCHGDVLARAAGWALTRPSR